MPTPLRKACQVADARNSIEYFQHMIDPIERERIVGALREGMEQIEGDPGYRPPVPRTVRISVRRLRGIVEHHVEDQVVVVRGGTSLKRLQRELQITGQCIPVPPFSEEFPLGGQLGFASLNALIGFNLPHVLEAQCGSWRDWVLGMTVVQADGTIAKGGSQAVKNVAGYDVQKLFIGARGTLGTVAEVILRTYPIKALPTPELVQGAAKSLKFLWIQRVLRTDFSEAIRTAGDDLILADRASSTLWCAVPPERELPRFAHDWVLRSGCGEKNLQITDPIQTKFMRRAKELFDPTHKLNPGEMGIF
ncbi:FAD-binding oxidoreductase [Fimbriimonas ginsengisoli]|uniref:FAD/FMN-dependent dehydrogenase n=1 Tax=Fimbriimonas ginsengisoli Gsoil 348 TaxID=661478 RepID=A0A068NU47_FIMGI|nr:FAD-binding oxidoreductase [Fimbriimonas ginsengisoli]AIE85109.1 FAD/FMN-dependent dehydrogenase [Fimbriimonas ginsengisoli Gsoil 348]